MKKTINGLTYNTDTAAEIAANSNGHYRNDFAYCEETLYKTKKGNFFLFGTGGAMSKYSEAMGNNSRCGGSGITPLTKEQALEWCENNEAEDAIELFFSDLVEVA